MNKTIDNGEGLGLASELATISWRNPITKKRDGLAQAQIAALVRFAATWGAAWRSPSARASRVSDVREELKSLQKHLGRTSKQFERLTTGATRVGHKRDAYNHLLAAALELERLEDVDLAAGRLADLIAVTSKALAALPVQTRHRTADPFFVERIWTTLVLHHPLPDPMTLRLSYAEESACFQICRAVCDEIMGKPTNPERAIRLFKMLKKRRTAARSKS